MFARAAAYAPALRQPYETRALPIVGPSSPGERAKTGSQRSINWFPVKPEREGDTWHLRGRPGLELLVNLPHRPIRGMINYLNRLFVVAGTHIYEVRSDGAYTSWGSIPSARGRVIMAYLLNTIVIGDGSGYFALDVNAGTVTAIADAPRGTYCVFFNQRILYQDAFSGQVFYSELNDPTNIPGANFFTAEALSDAVTAITTTEDQIWLHGEDSTEVWQDVGGASNPFQRIPGGVMYSGALYPATALRLDNSVWWVERDKDGIGIVRRSNGFTPVRVSTSPVERFIAEAADGGLSAYSYQEDGHTFYCLNARGDNTGGTHDKPTWCYDLQTGEWHERAWLNRETGVQERHRVEYHANCYAMNIVGDYKTGRLYRQGLDVFSDNGQEIRRTRVTQRMASAGKAVIIDELFLDFETGVGIDGSGQGTDPEVMLRAAPNGHNFGSELRTKLGKIGEFDSQVRFHGLGVGKDWAFEISVSDPVFTSLLGGEVKARVGRR